MSKTRQILRKVLPVLLAVAVAFAGFSAAPPSFAADTSGSMSDEALIHSDDQTTDADFSDSQTFDDGLSSEEAADIDLSEDELLNAAPSDEEPPDTGTSDGEMLEAALSGEQSLNAAPSDEETLGTGFSDEETPLVDEIMALEEMVDGGSLGVMANPVIGQKFTVGNLSYIVLMNTNTVDLIGCTAPSIHNPSIPATVNFEENTFSVVGIRSYAFENSLLTGTLTLPQTLITIEYEAFD
ncbi:MAG: hypothetical protein FWD43_05735, partial [Coriobacteriia bacterium]|nr:hypothetical protein [Coriobacteriia bacterium]